MYKQIAVVFNHKGSHQIISILNDFHKTNRSNPEPLIELLDNLHIKYVCIGRNYWLFPKIRLFAEIVKICKHNGWDTNETGFTTFT